MPSKHAFPTKLQPGHLPKGFVDVATVIPDILIDLRYAGWHNFVGHPLPGYESARLVLSSAATAALAKAQQHARAAGFNLKVYDGYRPQKTVDFLVRWSMNIADQKMKAEFYPLLDKARIFPDGYVSARSGHSRGSTVDVTLVHLQAQHDEVYRPEVQLRSALLPSGKRFGDNSVDMGTGFDAFDLLSHTYCPNISTAAKINRMRLVYIMAAAGFDNYAKEWWHYTLRNEPFPNTYFDFDP